MSKEFFERREQREENREKRTSSKISTLFSIFSFLFFKLMKYIITLIVIASFTAIGYGYSLDETEEKVAHKYIGGGTLSLFFIAMPLFLYKESKGKKMKDYMLTEENVRKMQGKTSKKK